MPRSSAYIAFTLCVALLASPAAAGDGTGCNQTADAQQRIEACTAILERQDEPIPDRFAAYVARGLAYEERGLWDRAIADFTSAIGLGANPAIANGDRAVAYNNRGTVFDKRSEYGGGELDRALADFERAIELDPKIASYYLNRGHASYVAGHTSQAIANYVRALELDPELTDAYFNRGLAYSSEGSHGKAIADYSRLIELSPKDAEAYLNRGISYYALGDFAKASADFLQAVQLSRNPHFLIWLYLAEMRGGQNAAPWLEVKAKRIASKLWPYPAIELYLGKTGPDSAFAAATGTPGQQCEANFYIAEWSILQNRPADARPLLQKAAETCDKLFPQYKMSAQAELKRLKP